LAIACFAPIDSGHFCSKSTEEGGAIYARQKSGRERRKNHLRYKSCLFCFAPCFSDIVFLVSTSPMHRNAVNSTANMVTVGWINWWIGESHILGLGTNVAWEGVVASVTVAAKT